MALKTLCLLDFRHKKRRPRTSFFVEVVEPGGFEPPSIPLTAGLSAFKLPFCCHFSKEACNSLQAS